MTTPQTDPLVSKVRAAVTSKAAFDSLESVVGEKPMFRTTTEAHVLMLRRQLVEDPDHPSEAPNLKDAKAAIYWDRKMPGDDPHVTAFALPAGDQPIESAAATASAHRT